MIDSSPIASLSGTEAPLFGEGPRLAALPDVVVEAALSWVMFVWKSLKESVGGAAIVGVGFVVSGVVDETTRYEWWWLLDYVSYLEAEIVGRRGSIEADGRLVLRKRSRRSKPVIE